MLTGHTKKLFEEWYNKKKFTAIGYYQGLGSDLEFQFDAEYFYNLDFSMQCGVYLEFLREQGYDVVIGYAYEFTEKPQYFYQISNGVERKSDCKTYPEYNTALTQAIQKCNELINERNK